MQALAETIKAWQLHPVVDHFTVALVIVSILVDLLGSAMASRAWPRTTALTLMVAGAAASWGSKLTGGWEAGRVWDNVKGPALDVLKRHAELGDYLSWAILALAVWRLGVQFLGFLAGSRPIYLMVAVVASGVILYQGHLGGELVYDYGVGTALMTTATPIESPAASPSATPAEASPIPTVFNPSASPTPERQTTPAASASNGASSAPPAASESATAAASPSASATPTANPSTTGGTPVNPPGGGASPGETPVPKNL